MGIVPDFSEVSNREVQCQVRIILFCNILINFFHSFLPRLLPSKFSVKGNRFAAGLGNNKIQSFQPPHVDQELMLDRV